MSRNYQRHQMAADEAAAQADHEERAEMRSQGIPTIDLDAKPGRSFSCEGCWQSWHPDEIDQALDGWCCPDCSTFHDQS